MKYCHILGRSLKQCLQTRFCNGKPARVVGSSDLCRRSLSGQTGKDVLVEREEGSAVALVKLNKKPVNSLSLETLTELHLAIEKLEGDKSCRGMILTSANPGVFSAGLDIMEMYQPDEARLREFWRSLQEVYLRLYGSGLITIAAINGHAPAGGCLLSMCTDYRILAAPKFTIGLNETLLGIVAPWWFSELLVTVVGQRPAELCLQLGRMLSSEEALQMGLVDQLAEVDQVATKAREEINKWLKVPDVARRLTKLQMRNPLLQKLSARREEDINYFVNFITKESAQKAMGIYLENLKKKNG